jgi:hypothetical protein
MNLYELPDNEFDSIFKKAAEQAEYPFNESAWNRFEQKLNRWKKFNPAFRRITGGLSIVLLGMIVWFVLRSLEADPFGLSLSPSGGTDHGRIKNQSVKPMNGLEHTTERSGLEREKRKSDEKYAHEEGQLVDKGEIRLNTEIKGQNKVSDLDNNKKTGVTPKNTGMTHSMKAEKFAKVNEGERAGRDIVGSDEMTGSNKDFQVDPVYRKDRLSGLGLPKTTGLMPERKNPEEMVSSLEVFPSGKNHFRPDYSLNLSIGPDFSGVGGNAFGTGSYLGLGFEWFLFRNWSIMIGVSHSRKKYAVEDEYTVPYSGTSIYGQAPDQVDIACHVLDIPINIYYSVFQDGKNRIFAGAGLSSYLMLTEEYHFEYSGQYYSNIIQDYKLNNENQHYFGIVNLSAGYTRVMNQRWSWQLEPYFKVPIQDIAAARVRLKSFGALISLKYRFQVK